MTIAAYQCYIAAKSNRLGVMMESSPAFLYGESLFTSSIARCGKMLFKRAHLQRLYDAIEDYYLDHSLNDEQKQVIQSKLDDFLEELGESDYRVRITAYSKNRENLLPESFDFQDLELMCEATKLISSPNAVSLKTFPSPFSEHYPNMKMGSYMPLLRLRKMAIRKGVNDALLVTGEKIVEASTSNIFFIKNENIFTPTKCLLNGIIKQNIEQEFPVQCTDISLEELGSFDGAFLTNSCNIVQAIGSINEVKYNNLHHELLGKIKKNLLERGFSEEEN
ncbi:MAG: aminotransferase class IV [Bacteriovoracaceae bacterium]|nr:aminotransferase class IV [Bacteriovoracaceae bacterium]